MQERGVDGGQAKTTAIPYACEDPHLSGEVIQVASLLSFHPNFPLASQV